jgi:hypothetical protein
LTELMRTFDGFIAIRKYVKVNSSEILQSESAFITASRYYRGQYMTLLYILTLLYISCVLEADFVSPKTGDTEIAFGGRALKPSLERRGAKGGVIAQGLLLAPDGSCKRL